MPSLTCCGYSVVVEDENRGSRRVTVRNREGDVVFTYAASVGVRRLMLFGFLIAGFDAVGKLGVLGGEEATRLLSILEDVDVENVEPWLPLLVSVDEEAARGLYFAVLSQNKRNAELLLPLIAKVLDVDAATLARLRLTIVVRTVFNDVGVELGVLASGEKAGLCKGRVAVIARAIAMMAGDEVVVRCVDGKARVEIGNMKFVVEERGGKLALVLRGARRYAEFLAERLAWLGLDGDVLLAERLVDAYAAALLLVATAHYDDWEDRLAGIISEARGNPHLIATRFETLASTHWW